MIGEPNYFDFAASSPPYEEALTVYSEYSRDFYSNPSAIHKAGNQANHALSKTKNEFCDLLNFSDGRLVLCSSCTEANNLAIEGHMHHFDEASILIAEDVHDSIWYARTKYPANTAVFKIDQSGKIDVDKLIDYMRENPVTMLAMSHVSGETGIVHPLLKITNFCHNNNIKLLLDGAQALGHIKVDFNRINCNYYSFSGHKFGAPKGIGGLLIRDDDLAPVLSGGKHEWGLRAGTENLPGIAAATIALKSAQERLNDEQIRLQAMTNLFTKKVEAEIDTMLFNSDEESVPGFVSVSFPGHNGSEIVTALSLEGFAVSTGSACHANNVEPSRIILAMGRTNEQASGTVRITMGRTTTEASQEALAKALIAYLTK